MKKVLYSVGMIHIKRRHQDQDRDAIQNDKISVAGLP